MALVCPVGHPDGPGQAFCPLCGRGKVQVPDAVAGHLDAAPDLPELHPAHALAGAPATASVPAPPGWFPEAPIDTLGTAAAWIPPQPLATPAAAVHDLAPPEDPAVPEAPAQTKLRGRAKRPKEAKPAKQVKEAKPVKVAAPADDAQQATQKPFAGITAALSAKPVAGAAVSFLSGAVLAGAAVHALA